MPLSSMFSWELALCITKGFGSEAVRFTLNSHMFAFEHAGETLCSFD